MKEKLMIRKAHPDEWKKLWEIERSCFPPAEAASGEMIERRLKTFPENFVVAELNGQAVGFINGGNTDEQYLPDEMYHDISLHKPDGSYQTLFGLNVIAEYRKHGIAKQLVLAYILLAKEHGKKGIILTCKDHMIHYYEKFGFVNYGAADSAHGGAKWNDMRLLF